MFDDFQFSNGQALSTLNSTGVTSTNYWDLEEGVSTDQMVIGWINGIILSTTSTGGDSGLIIEVRSSDATTLATTPMYLGARTLLQSEIVAGFKFSIGIYACKVKKYLGTWYRTVNESLTGATAVDAWFSEQPHAELKVQKKNSSAGA
jgi:hypothetical protein